MNELSGRGGGGNSSVIGRVNLHTVVDPDGILVTGFTSPEHMVDISKATAVVTDTGGAMSHAAVVCTARGIPFVVGTGKATEVLQQGEYIEVDPVAGVVRRLA